MLTAHPKKWYSWDFTLQDAEGRRVADVDLSSWRERGNVGVGQSEYRVRPEGLFRQFVLEDDVSVRARARKTRLFGCEFEIEFEGDHFTLKKQSMWSHTVVLHQGGEELGVIAPQHAQLPAAVPHADRHSRPPAARVHIVGLRPRRRPEISPKSGGHPPTPWQG